MKDVELPYSSKYPPTYRVVPKHIPSGTSAAFGEEPLEPPDINAKSGWRSLEVHKHGRLDQQSREQQWHKWVLVNRDVDIPAAQVLAYLNPKAALEEEAIRVIIETYRAMADCYGDVLYFSEPKRSCSFCYRSEYKFRADSWTDRFAWMVHFYQAASASGSTPMDDRSFPVPIRYSGFVFVRPWEVHLKESESDTEPERLNNAQHHVKVAPAVCEGYVRPRLSLTRPPFSSQCVDYYAAPYGTRPFRCIPFFASAISSACGHSALASALIIARARATLSPYELAVAASEFRSPPEDPDGDDRGLSLADACVLINKSEWFPGLRAIIEKQPPSRRFGRTEEEEFAERLASFVCQGMPVLYAVDSSLLYSEESDRELIEKDKHSAATPKEYRHIILIHSFVGTGKNPKTGHAVPIFVFSDSADLHRTGNIFQRASCKRLWASRLKKSQSEYEQDLRCTHRPHAVRKRVDLLKGEHGAAAMLACVPQWFEVSRTRVEARLYPLLRNRHRLLSWLGREPKFHLTLRDRSQLRGFLLHRVFRLEFEDHSTSPTHQREIAKFREALRQLDLPPLVWIAEVMKATGSSHGYILDTRKEVPLPVKGMFSLAKKCIKLTGYYVSGDKGEERLKGFALEQNGASRTNTLAFTFREIRDPRSDVDLKPLLDQSYW